MMVMENTCVYLSSGKNGRGETRQNMQTGLHTVNTWKTTCVSNMELNNLDIHGTPCQVIRSLEIQLVQNIYNGKAQVDLT